MDDFHTTGNAQLIHEAEICVPMPAFSCTSLNRCNLPSAILGSYTYQQHPVPLQIDCVLELHADFFSNIKTISCAQERSIHFRQYMRSAFLLDKSEDAGSSSLNKSKSRHKIDYLRLLRGWMFNPDGIEAAVMKRWVESRFGLLTLKHGDLLRSADSAVYQDYQSDTSLGLYNTNALEAQLDLLYSYCQYELQRSYPNQSHWQLFRGVNNIAKHIQIGDLVDNKQLLLLNNLSSFSSDALLSETFGDIILEIKVPATKLLFFPELLKGVLAGEHEYLVIGGVYQAHIQR